MPEQSRSHHRRLDPTSPLVIDTRELGRRPGSMREVHRSAPAPTGLGIDVLAVPEGSDLEVDLRLEAVQEGVLVSGRVRAAAAGECVRCLDVVRVDLDVPVQELFVYPGGRERADEEDELPELEGDLIELEPTVHDAVVLALPLQPVCRDDCPGLCSVCGQRLAEDPGHQHDDVDPRWAALQGLIDDEEES